ERRGAARIGQGLRLDPHHRRERFRGVDFFARLAFFLRPGGAGELEQGGEHQRQAGLHPDLPVLISPIVKLISWNIQWCRGVDGKVDPARIARVTQELCDPDVICFQEVAENYDSLAGSAGENQPALLEAHFRGYSVHFACAVDVPDGKGGRRRFGNMVLSRLPVRQVFNHSLPWPAETAVPNMPRVALEA